MGKLVVGVIGALFLVIYMVNAYSGNNEQDGPANKGSERAAARASSGYSVAGHNVAALADDRIKELAKELSAEQRHIILEEGTEQAFTGDLLKNKKEGVYACRLCSLPVYKSEAKFTSGTGWPSFYEPFDPAHVREQRDTSLGSVRTEIECSRCGGHLGHVFNDGPKPTGLRYCMNSASLRFFEKGSKLPPEARPVEKATAYFAGGCFWGVEDRFQQVPGVIDAVSGYQGGHKANPTYKEVCGGETGHAESVRVTFDPKRVSYGKLLEWFFKFHDPTQMNRQGPDVGTQYRSAIFAANEKQLAEAKAFIEAQSQTERFRDRKIATVVGKAGPFSEAEDYHQNYHVKHGGSCPIPTGK